MGISIFVPILTVYENGFYTKEEKSTEKKQLFQLNGSLNGFVVGIGTRWIQ